MTKEMIIKQKIDWRVLQQMVYQNNEENVAKIVCEWRDYGKLDKLGAHVGKDAGDFESAGSVFQHVKLEFEQNLLHLCAKMGHHASLAKLLEHGSIPVSVVNAKDSVSGLDSFNVCASLVRSDSLVGGVRAGAPACGEAADRERRRQHQHD